MGWEAAARVATLGAQPLTATRMGATGPTWVRESWTVRDGLPVNSINWILQDRAGFIWAATYDGLVRFDGVRFTVYKVANSPGLPSNRLLRLRETRDGSLWIFSEQDHVVRLRDGVFTNFTRPSSNSSELVPTPFEEDTAGTIWLGSSDGLWTLRGDSVQRFPGALGTLPVTGIVARRDGSLWVSTFKRGIYRIGNGGRQAQRIAVDPGLDTAIVHQVYEDAAGALWIAALEGMWTGRDRFARVDLPRAIYSPFSWLDSRRDGAVYVDTRTGLYRIADLRGEQVDERALTNTGVRVWNHDGSLWHASGAQVLRDGQPVFAIGDDSLPPRENPTAITTVLVDREGSIWLGTRAAGLHRLKPGVATTYGVPEGVGRNAQTVYARKDGSIWVGVWDEGVRRIDPSTGRATVAPMTSGEFGITNAIGEGADGSLLIGAGRGLHACDWAMLRCAVQGPPDYHRGRVLALHRDRRGTVWVGLSRRAVLRGDSTGWTPLVDILPPDARSVPAIADTRDGAVWFGTSGVGLIRYRDGRATVITTRDGLPTDIIRSLHEDEDGWLWIGTGGGGLARLDPREWGGGGTTPAAKRRIVTLSSAQGLFDDVVHTILEDNFGRLWMSGNRGVSWIARNELAAYAEGKIARVRAVGYDERDGMRNREANGGKQPAGAKGIDGRLWFPTQDGVVVFDPRLVRQDSIAPPAVVERVVTARGTPHIRTSVVRPIDASGDEAGAEVSLDVDQRDFQIEYTALTFLEPGNVRFRYRLEGYDTRWVDADRRRIAFYTKVPPGTYTFRVQASTSSGDWREPGTSLVVHVAPRIWETTFFRWGAALAVVAWLLWAVRRRIRAAGARARELQQVVDERTRALRERERELAAQNEQLAGLADELKSLDHAKTRFFANVSHELRTPLTLTIGPLDDLRARTASDPQSTRLVDLASRNARRLLRLVNQILDVAKLEAGEMKLAPRVFDLVPFVRGLVAAFAPAADRGGIRLETVAPDALWAHLDPDALEKILTNLLSNALKFTPSGGRVTFSLAPAGDDAVFVVRDTGPGIPADQLAHVFERFYQVDESRGRTQPGTGIGLALVKELVDVQRGTVAASSNAGGATFTVRLPLGAVPSGTREAAPLPPIDATIVTAEHAPSDPGDTHVAVAADDDADDDARPHLPTLLVVDDSEDLRHYIADHFAARFRIVQAGDGAAGISMARRHLPDVIVSDVMMPGTDGLTLVRTLRESPETDFLPVILLTAQAEDEQRIAGLERGADDYLVKPFEMRELDVRVRNIIASRQRLRARYIAKGAPPPPAGGDLAGRVASSMSNGDEGPAAHGGMDVSTPSDAVATALPVPALAPADRVFAERVLAVMRQHLADPDFGVGELADAVATDRSHLFRRVKQLLGESPSALLRQMRLEEGRRLLSSEDATVADVAYAVGFNSVSHFSQAFAAHFGISPAAFRDRGG